MPRATLFTLAFLLTSTISATPALADSPTARAFGGIDRVNEYRALAGLPAVSERADWVTALTNHSRYMVKNTKFVHEEDPENPWYTTDGAAAGLVAFLAPGVGPIDPIATIDKWMADPFRGIAIIDATMTEAGYGSYYDSETANVLNSGAALDVARGIGAPPTAFPVQYPAAGAVSPLTTMTDAAANLLQPLKSTSCAGFEHPVGAPIYLQMGDGTTTPSVTASTLQTAGVTLDHCVFDESTFDAPNGAERDAGRAILDARDAIVIIPRQPLVSGRSYCASVTVNGVTHEWAFAVGSGPVTGCDAQPTGASVTIGLVDGSQGQWHLRNSAGGVTSFYFGNPGDFPIMGDWDCNGTDTPGMYRQSDGFVYVRNSNTVGVADRQFFLGNPGDIPLAGDFNGDGCDTVSIYRPSEQRFYISNTLAANNAGISAAFSFLFGNPGDKPVTGDWDGDGITEIGLHRESTGFFYWRNTLDTGNGSGEIFFGDPGDRFVAGDWGVVDGIDTPAVFRPSGATFFFRHTLTQGNADSQFAFGEPLWLPVAGAFGLG